MKKIIIYVCSIIISISVLTSCDSKPSNTPGAAASSETVHESKEEKEPIESKIERIPVESETATESGFPSEEYSP